MHRLGLDESQAAEFAAIIDDLKIEHAQAFVDHRRAVSAMVQLFAGERFDREAAGKIADERTEGVRRLHTAIIDALHRAFEVLTPEQRQHLVTLVRARTAHL